MADQKILVNGNRVIASGTVTTLANHQIEINPLPPSYGPFRIVLSFETKENEKPGWRGLWTDKTYNVTFINFGNTLGGSLTDAAEIGKMGDRRILMFLSTHVFGDTAALSRVLNYTFTVDGDADV